MAKLASGRAPAAVAERIPVSAADQKILFALSGNVCAFPGCNRQVVEPATAHDDAAVVGHIAHIVGASRQGPRGAEALSDAQRASHINLVLLCRDHHAIVDAQPRTYSVQVLRQIKRDHEARIAKLKPMRQLSITPNITVTIGRHTRIYYAFVTSASADLDAPATMTLPEALNTSIAVVRHSSCWPPARAGNVGAGVSAAQVNTVRLIGLPGVPPAVEHE